MFLGNSARPNVSGDISLSKALTTLLALVFLGASASAQDFVPGEVIVKLKSGRGSAASYAFMGKASSDKEMLLKQSFGKMNMYHLHSAGRNYPRTLRSYRTMVLSP